MPVVEQLPCVQLESEAKRTSVKITKQTVVPIVEGTSVAPRQRPKGGQPLPVGGVLPIPIGSSPVPSARRHTAPLPLPSVSQSPVSLNGPPHETVTPAPPTTPNSGAHTPQLPSQTFFPSPVLATVTFEPRTSAAASVQDNPAVVKSAANSRESLEALFPVSGKYLPKQK